MVAQHEIVEMGGISVRCRCGWRHIAPSPDRWSGPAALRDHLLDAYNAHLRRAGD